MHNKFRLKTLIIINILLMIFSFIAFSFSSNFVYAEETPVYSNDVTYEDLINHSNLEIFEKNGKKFKFDNDYLYELNIKNETIVENQQEIVKIPSLGMTKSFDSASKKDKKAFLYSLAFAIPKTKTIRKDFTINYLDLIYLKYYSDVVIHNVDDLKNTNNVKNAALIEHIDYDNNYAHVENVDVAYFDNSISESNAKEKFQHILGVNVNDYHKEELPLFVYSSDINKQVSKTEIEKQLNYKYNELISLKDYNFDNTPNLFPNRDIEDDSENYFFTDYKNEYEHYKMRKRVKNNQKIKYTNWSSELNFFDKIWNQELFKNYTDKNVETNNYIKISNSSDIEKILIDDSEKKNLNNFFDKYKTTHDVYVLYFDFYETDYISKSKIYNDPDLMPYSIAYNYSPNKVSRSECNLIKDFKIYQDLETIEMSTSYKNIYNKEVTEIVKTFNKPIEILIPNLPENPQQDVELSLKNFFDKIMVLIEAIMYAILILFLLIVFFYIIHLIKIALSPIKKTHSYYKNKKNKNRKK